MRADGAWRQIVAVVIAGRLRAKPTGLEALPALPEQATRHQDVYLGVRGVGVHEKHLAP